jgi:hypothetical protein
MEKPPFPVIWQRIVVHAGLTFWTKTALPFTYAVADDVVQPAGVGRGMVKRDIAAAYALVPFAAPGGARRGESQGAYLWGLLHDPRILRVVGRYYPLEAFLLLVPRHLDTILLSFAQVEVILRLSLPTAAVTTRQWWRNSRPHAPAGSWRRAGFEVEKNGVDLDAGWVRFRRLPDRA